MRSSLLESAYKGKAHKFKVGIGNDLSKRVISNINERKESAYKTPSGSLQETAITDIAALVQTNVPGRVRLRSGEIVYVKSQLAEQIIGAYKMLNEQNKTRFENELGGDRESFYRMVEFVQTLSPCEEEDLL